MNRRSFIKSLSAISVPALVPIPQACPAPIEDMRKALSMCCFDVEQTICRGMGGWWDRIQCAKNIYPGVFACNGRILACHPDPALADITVDALSIPSQKLFIEHITIDNVRDWIAVPSIRESDFIKEKVYDPCFCYNEEDDFEECKICTHWEEGYRGKPVRLVGRLFNSHYLWVLSHFPDLHLSAEPNSHGAYYWKSSNGCHGAIMPLSEKALVHAANFHLIGLPERLTKPDLEWTNPHRFGFD